MRKGVCPFGICAVPVQYWNTPQLRSSIRLGNRTSSFGQVGNLDDQLGASFSATWCYQQYPSGVLTAFTNLILLASLLCTYVRQSTYIFAHCRMLIGCSERISQCVLPNPGIHSRFGLYPPQCVFPRFDVVFNCGKPRSAKPAQSRRRHMLR